MTQINYSINKHWQCVSTLDLLSHVASSELNGSRFLSSTKEKAWQSFGRETQKHPWRSPNAIALLPTLSCNLDKSHSSNLSPNSNTAASRKASLTTSSLFLWPIVRSASPLVSGTWLYHVYSEWYGISLCRDLNEGGWLGITIILVCAGAI